MNRSFLPGLLILLILASCVSNRRFRKQEDALRDQETELSSVQETVAGNSDAIGELVIRLNSVYEQLMDVSRMQEQINETAASIDGLEQEIDVIVARINEIQNPDSGPDRSRRDSARYATKYELGLLAEVCVQVARNLRKLTLEVQNISGELGGSLTTDRQILLTRQAVLRGILDRVSGLESELNAVARLLQTTDPGAREELERLRGRVAGINDGLNGLTSELGGVIQQSQLEARISREHNINKEYQIALAEYYKGNHERSIRLFEAFLRSHPEGPFSPNAEYWIAENYYGAGVFAKALRQFIHVADKYPAHHKGWDARLKAGITYYHMGDAQSAYQELMKIKKEYPAYTGMPLVDLFLGKVRP